MSLTEATRLTRIIRADPSSAMSAAIEGWDHPVPRTDAILMDIWDALSHQVYKKPKPYPRPFSLESAPDAHGDTAGRSSEQVRDLLARSRLGQPEAPV